MTKKTFPIPFYRGKMTVVIADTLHDAAKSIGYNGINEDDDSYGICLTNYNEERYSILLPEYSLDRHGTIAHECKHLVNAVFMNKGVKLDPDNDEAECYFLGWVVDNVYKVIDLHKRNK